MRDGGRPLIPQTYRAAVVSALVIALLTLVPATVAVVSLNGSQQRGIRNFSIQLCRSNNITKSVIHNRISAGRPRRALLDTLVLLNCDATFGHGAPVALLPRVVRQFDALIASGWVPIVRGGEIVAKRRPEAGKIADF